MRLAPFAAAAAVAVVVAAPAGAETFRATRTDDPTPNGCKPQNCSLREAVLAANHHDGRDLIVLRAGKTYSLSRRGPNEDRGQTGDLDLVGSVVIRSVGDGHATIDAHRIDAVFDARRARHPLFTGLVIRHGRLAGGGRKGAGGITGGRIEVVRSILTDNAGPDAGAISAGTLHLKHSIVRHNNATGFLSAGGIRAEAMARIEGSRVVRNRARNFGGVFSDGSMNLRNSVVRRNRAASTGGVEVQGSGHSMTSVINSGISRNRGEVGGIAAGLRSVVVRDSRVANNVGRNVGGLDASVQQAFIVADSVISGNTAQDIGGIFVAGIACGSCHRPSPHTIVRTTVANNRGGGHLGAGGIETLVPLHVRQSALNGNRSRNEGGAIHSYLSRVILVNSTVARNKADGDGGGIAAWHMTLRSSTIVHNRSDADGRDGGAGGGVFARSPHGGSTAANTLLAFNATGRTGGGPQCWGRFRSLGHNIRTSDDTRCRGFTRKSDLVRRHVRIGHLAPNGGPTKTIRLKKRSPAIGHASRQTSPKRDQRGVRRDRRPDVGAFERR